MIIPTVIGHDRAAELLVRARIERAPLRRDEKLRSFECVIEARAGRAVAIRVRNPELLVAWIDAWVGHRPRPNWAFRVEYQPNQRGNAA